MQLARDFMAVNQKAALAGSDSLHGEVPLPSSVTLIQPCMHDVTEPIQVLFTPPMNTSGAMLCM